MGRRRSSRIGRRYIMLLTEEVQLIATVNNMTEMRSRVHSLPTERRREGEGRKLSREESQAVDGGRFYFDKASSSLS